MTSTLSALPTTNRPVYDFAEARICPCDAVCVNFGETERIGKLTARHLRRR